MRWLLVVFALVVSLTACDNRSIMGCTSAADCGTTKSESPSAVLSAIETSLQAARFTRDGQTNSWKRGSELIHITPDLNGSYVIVSFPEGMVRCDDIYQTAATPDPLARFNALKAMTHIQALGVEGCDVA